MVAVYDFDLMNDLHDLRMIDISKNLNRRIKNGFCRA